MNTFCFEHLVAHVSINESAEEADMSYQVKSLLLPGAVLEVHCNCGNEHTGSAVLRCASASNSLDKKKNTG